MERTPPSQSEPRTRSKSASRLSKSRYCSEESGSPTPILSLEIVPSSPKTSTSSPAPTISPTPPYAVPLKELLMLSPSPRTRSKTRLAERLEMADGAPIEACGSRKRCKNRSSGNGSGASPRNTRRSRRRLEQDMREEREIIVAEEELVKPRKKRRNERSKKDKLVSAQIVPSKRKNYGLRIWDLGTIDGDSYDLGAIGEIINELVMWKDVSKSSLWFGFGSLCFLSSCFARGANFSIFSFLSQVGLLFLGVSFCSNSLRQRDATPIVHEFKLKEEDILRVGRLILPAANLVISKAREIFSGEPAMTLKMVPILLVGAEYGHLITLWRLCALGFFISFTGPKVYSAYSSQLSKKAEYVKYWALEAWGSCARKKAVAASAVMAFWNLASIRTRIFAVFLCVVILRYHRQHSEAKVDQYSEEGKGKKKTPLEETVKKDASNGKQEEQHEKALVAVEIESKS